MTCQTCEETKKRMAELEYQGYVWRLHVASVCLSCEHMITEESGYKHCKINCCPMVFTIANDALVKGKCPVGKW